MVDWDRIHRFLQIGKKKHKGRSIFYIRFSSI